jgi:hypothetical protein
MANPRGCECAPCVAMGVCIKCRSRITGTRTYQRETVAVDLIHEGFAMVGPLCEACRVEPPQTPPQEER